jgi:hypothetical protein
MRFPFEARFEQMEYLSDEVRHFSVDNK